MRFLPALGSLFALACSASVAADDEEQTYLVSLQLDLAEGESLSEFRFDTWGIDFEAICHIPSGWRIEAGNNAVLEGVLRGEGSHGATWLTKDGLAELDTLALVKMFGPVVKDADGEAQPATFAGEAVVGWGGRRIRLSHSNIKLTIADGCP